MDFIHSNKTHASLNQSYSDQASNNSGNTESLENQGLKSLVAPRYILLVTGYVFTSGCI